jgi:hypothetical protein
LRGESGGVVAPTPGDAAATGGGAGAPRWLATLGYVVAGLIVIVGGLMAGMWWQRHRMAGATDGLEVARAMPTPTRTIPIPTDALPTQTPPDRPAPTPSPTPTATPTPTPSPTATPYLYDNWEWDRDQVLRVRLPMLCEAAAYLILVRQWHPTIDISHFSDATPEEVSQFDLLKTMEQQLNFKAFATDKLNEALRFDLPVIVRISAGGERFGPYGVLTAMRGRDVLELADPLYGKSIVSLRTLEPLVTQAVVLYKDTEGWVGLAPGATGDAVSRLQQWLVTQGFYQGTIDGKYGTLTRDAMQRWQERQSLEPTGALDTPTAIFIYHRLNPRRPKLFS